MVSKAGTVIWGVERRHAGHAMSSGCPPWQRGMLPHSTGHLLALSQTGGALQGSTSLPLNTSNKGAGFAMHTCRCA